MFKDTTILPHTQVSYNGSHSLEISTMDSTITWLEAGGYYRSMPVGGCESRSGFCSRMTGIRPDLRGTLRQTAVLILLAEQKRDRLTCGLTNRNWRPKKEVRTSTGTRAAFRTGGYSELNMDEVVFGSCFSITSKYTYTSQVTNIVT